MKRLFCISVLGVIVASTGSALAAPSGPYLVLKHNLSTLGNPLYRPSALYLPGTARFGGYGQVQRLRWTHWGTSRAVGRGVIVASASGPCEVCGAEPVVAHVTLVASHLVPLFNTSCQDGNPVPLRGPVKFRRYGSLRARLRWTGDYADGAQESRAVSGNLAGTPTQQC